MTRPIRKPKLEILVSKKIFAHDNAGMVRMSDGMSYSHPEFAKHPEGTRFAVLREMDTSMFGGMICQVLACL